MSDTPLTLKDLVGARVTECRDDSELVFDNGMSLWAFEGYDDPDLWEIDWTANRMQQVSILATPDRLLLSQPNPPHPAKCDPPWRVKVIAVPRWGGGWWKQVELRVETAPTVGGDIDFDRWKWWNEENTVMGE